MHVLRPYKHFKFRYVYWIFICSLLDFEYRPEYENLVFLLPQQKERILLFFRLLISFQWKFLPLAMKVGFLWPVLHNFMVTLNFYLFLFGKKRILRIEEYSTLLGIGRNYSSSMVLFVAVYLPLWFLFHFVFFVRQTKVLIFVVSLFLSCCAQTDRQTDHH